MGNAMPTEIAELVKVGVVFEPGEPPLPKWFIWRGRRYPVERMTFHWKVRDGQVALHHFAVISGANLYELRYNTVTLEWMLMVVSPMGQGA
jgi:hypothetical protein